MYGPYWNQSGVTIYISPTLTTIASSEMMDQPYINFSPQEGLLLWSQKRGPIKVCAPGEERKLRNCGIGLMMIKLAVPLNHCTLLFLFGWSGEHSATVNPIEMSILMILFVRLDLFCYRWAGPYVLLKTVWAWLLKPYSPFKKYCTRIQVHVRPLWKQRQKHHACTCRMRLFFLHSIVQWVLFNGATS